MNWRCPDGGAVGEFSGWDIEYPNPNAFHPEDQNMNTGYNIGEYYEIGEDYALGENYMIGAPMQLMPGMARPMALPGPQAYRMPQQFPVVQQMRPPVIVRKKDPTESRLQPVGCNVETDIAVGATGVATTRPQKVFKPERFTVPDTVAPDFLIDGIFVGVYLQSPSNTAIPAEAFLPTSIYSNVDFETCQISQELTVRARNRGGAPRPFFSTFFGRVLQ